MKLTLFTARYKTLYKGRECFIERYYPYLNKKEAKQYFPKRLEYLGDNWKRISIEETKD